MAIVHPAAPRTPAPVPSQDIANIRAPFRQATLLPAVAYHDEAVYAWEREEIFFRDWIAAGRAEEVPEAGSFVLRELFGEQVIIVRGRDDVIRAFYNVCRHRGTAVEERECGKAVRFQCPYHAWIYDLDGSLVRAKHTEDLEDFSFASSGLQGILAATWQGFVFLNLGGRPVMPLEDQLGDLEEHMRRFDFARLRSAKRIEYEVDANWKFIAENYSECYHCPGVHPQLNKLTPYDLGGDYDPDGAWQGGWMELVGGAETMALDGGHGSRGGRPPMCGVTPEDEVRIYYYVLWPLAFLSIHPDYLLVHRLVPTAAAHTTVICDWLFEEETMAAPGFDPSEPVAFWDLTNQQDWHVCELQQRGTRSRSWTAGRYSNNEASVHAFDLMVADRYAGDGLESHRTVRERYDTPPPKVDPGHHHANAADVLHHAETDRHTARAKAAVRAP